jgi:hypothetical protein
MGCGASSLKGDDVPDLNSQPVATTDPANQPMRKVKTNFSDINYDQDANKRRMTEYAPHETPPPIREQSHDLSAEKRRSTQAPDHIESLGSDVDPRTAASYPHESRIPGSETTAGDPDAALKPYQTIDGGDWDENEAHTNPTSQHVVNGTSFDPTSESAKDSFATANDPANPLNQESHHQQQQQHQENGTAGTSGSTGDEHKKSWLGQKYASLQSAKRGPGASDEDIKKYTGKEKQELEQWASGRAGVGGNQPADRVGTDSGIAAGAAWS